MIQDAVDRDDEFERQQSSKKFSEKFGWKSKVLSGIVVLLVVFSFVYYYEEDDEDEDIREELN